MTELPGKSPARQPAVQRSKSFGSLSPSVRAARQIAGLLAAEGALEAEKLDQKVLHQARAPAHPLPQR